MTYDAGRNDEEIDRRIADLERQLAKAKEQWQQAVHEGIDSTARAINAVVERDAANAALAEAVKDMRFLLSFVPAWAKDVPEGLDPTFYGTLTAAGDREVKARVDAITARIEAKVQPEVAR